MFEIISKYKSFILYAFFGVCTTLVNIIVYYVTSRILNMGTISSNIIAWVLAVLFAYITNRIWVFESEVDDKRGVIREIVSFVSCRVLTGLMDVTIMYIFVDIFCLNDMVIKISSNALVIVSNYIASKLVIFKKGVKDV